MKSQNPMTNDRKNLTKFQIRKIGHWTLGFGAFKKGFTLIELLVVIAIIGLLSTLAVVALAGARVKSRDARRLSDLKSISTALEMYNNDVGGYPITSTVQIGDANHACLNSQGFKPTGCTGTVYLANLPKDPKSGYYLYSGGGNNFAVSTGLEGVMNGYSGYISATPNGPVNDNFAGLVGWWKLDDGGGLQAIDSSGNNNLGIFTNNPAWVTGQDGGALQFDGTNKKVIANIANLPTSQLTISLWVKPGAQQVDFKHLYGVGGGHNATLYIIPNSYQVAWKFSTSIGGLSNETPFGTIDANWHHLVITYDGTAVKGYVDSVLGNTLPGSGPVSYLNNLFVIGGTDAGNSMVGYLDDVRFYNRALSATEVKAMYDAQK